ncbi:MAG: glycoside hydrolase family 140 protein [Bacteroidales bacterium]|nr:glycoside hydrolase family 140 protein [Bacteroidales bacterium]
MMKTLWITLLLLIIVDNTLIAQENVYDGPAARMENGRLQVSKNGRFLEHANGKAFFYLGETAWELFHRLSCQEAEIFLENRREKGFTVIQAVILAEENGLIAPSVNGEVPLLDMDPSRPNEDYFRFVDSIVEMAAAKGLYMGLLPTWGDKVDKQWGQGPVIFNQENAFLYGAFLGERYRDHPNIIWIIGGDRPCKGNEPVWEALARGIRSTDGNHLMTFHPMGSRSSSECFHQAEWLDFNMHQSGHSDRYIPNYRKIHADYALDPPKPCMDAEPIYESHPFGWNPKNGTAGEDEVRRAAYWALFSGAHGHTYGNHCIWQFYSAKVKAVNYPPMPWYEAMDLPGAWDMLHVRQLMESRPMLERYPDQSVISGNAGGTVNHIAATQGDGYAFVYLPSNFGVVIEFSRIKGDAFKTWWYNPRTGESTFIREVQGEPRERFTVPLAGVDWVLVIDDASKNFPEPGTL